MNRALQKNRFEYLRNPTEGFNLMILSVQIIEDSNIVVTKSGEIDIQIQNFQFQENDCLSVFGEKFEIPDSPLVFKYKGILKLEEQKGTDDVNSRRLSKTTTITKAEPEEDVCLENLSPIIGNK